eukprot:TRINITY_DN13681_c0_g1_i3.p3 TRINITY_DN13681_c0_g1~~TRINITY_DN13681_c0_g1_i3.p3  ORF type:complete len:108 (-),score=5.53 TRINITY_DN13681_c0_g1_i3:601-924(-)
MEGSALRGRTSAEAGAEVKQRSPATASADAALNRVEGQREQRCFDDAPHGGQPALLCLNPTAGLLVVIGLVSNLGKGPDVSRLVWRTMTRRSPPAIVGTAPLTAPRR